jgi:hypothetical protein
MSLLEAKLGQFVKVEPQLAHPDALEKEKLVKHTFFILVFLLVHAVSTHFIRIKGHPNVVIHPINDTRNNIITDGGSSNRGGSLSV